LSYIMWSENQKFKEGRKDDLGSWRLSESNKGHVESTRTGSAPSTCTLIVQEVAYAIGCNCHHCFTILLLRTQTENLGSSFATSQSAATFEATPLSLNVKDAKRSTVLNRGNVFRESSRH
jgi:hypothetical protein